MKVIKSTLQTGICLESFGADIIDNFAVGTRKECLSAIKDDMIRSSENGIDNVVAVSVDGIGFDEDFEDDFSISDYIDRVDDSQVMFNIRVQVDDVYSSIYDITYRIFE